MSANRLIIIIVGPTAGGKTTYAIELAQRLPGGGECICADSMQVYRGMDIGTAKPTAQERTRVPHHVLDVADPAKSDFTVDRWLRLAEAAIADIRSRDRWPIVVGGTNLYVKALLEGLFEGLPPDDSLRVQLDEQTTESLRAQLEQIDPAAASRIHRNDRRRTIRALEVFHQTGRPISDHQQQWNRQRMRADAIIIGLEYPIPLINRRINARVKSMMEQGLLKEVTRLQESGRLGPQAREALGYKQLLEHLKGGISLEEAVEEIKIRTRRFAKQQRTWLRQFRLLPQSVWFAMNAEDSPLPVESALEWITRATVCDDGATARISPQRTEQFPTSA